MQKLITTLVYIIKPQNKGEELVACALCFYLGMFLLFGW